MTDQLIKHREKIQTLLSEPNVFPHQRNAARNTYQALQGETRAVIMAAEMQAGKSGVALATACYQRNNLSDDDMCNPKYLRDTLYVMTMADTTLLAQAKEDLKPAGNVVVSNLVRFLADIEKHFRRQDPKLIIIDECHYGSGDTSVRYEALFDYLQTENTECRVVFISATPLSALLATEGDSLINRGIQTKLVFHRTSDDYFGVREMLAADQVVNLEHRTRNIQFSSSAQSQFIEHFNSYDGEGWGLVRVPAGTAMEAKRFLATYCVPEENIFILGIKLTGVPEDQHTSIDDFKDEYKTAMEFGQKVIAITVAGCRAGINFGFDMKENIIATWDSTVSNIAAVVQANIGRACGYHTNRQAMHFTNLDATRAYGELLSYLEHTCSHQATGNIRGLREKYNEICKKYEVKGLDVGARVNKTGELKGRKKLNDAQTYLTEGYYAIPAKLDDPDFDFTTLTKDKLILDTIGAIRNVYLKSLPIVAKASRSLRGVKWIKAHWVNGDTYDNPEKALALGTMWERALNLTTKFDAGEDVEFNLAVTPGGNEKTSDKFVAVKIFSVYNKSRRNTEKQIMTEEDVHDVCRWFSAEPDDTLFLIFKRGEHCPTRSIAKESSAKTQIAKGNILEANHFQTFEENT
ncbi:DEAD/DEAH box helicase family protein [Paraglaciecola chathamensis]|uniref:DEAD/DEAH box helicase family protein n=1 Tax=Paraglaciecola chathamensis TaxID=368405 RepID=A0ABS0WG92_9ALTE|nr:DEAD/DEAH box helicase family protein [Paraglaciecola chathamensis]MBJ2137460.1 DEAD/DEAH box helicase family protein [Paraglaciecola chathamensis]